MADIKPVSSLPEAAVFTDGCAGNYAHWLTEVLPRMAAFCADPRFKDVPLVVDQGLHVNIQASLRMVAGDHRQVHELALGQTMRVERLYWMSVAGYVPYERRTSLASGHAQGVFSPFALGLVREVGLRSAGATFNSGRAECGRKIFLKRNAHIRKIVNAQALEAQLTARGFEVVEPEKLSFVEQVSLMSQADCIVGPNGAAFANLIFAPPDAQVVVLMGEHPDTSYDYWSNIAHAVGLKVTCLRGPSINDGKGIHSDFVIDVDALDRALRPH
jgi:capsular polysaccharide biosynthesis protein